MAAPASLNSAFTFSTPMAFPTDIIFSSGDLYIDISTTSKVETRFLVDSHVVYVNSPVFRAMFGPDSSFKERKALEETKNEIPSIVLHDDDPDSWRIVFNILHGRHKKVPRTVTHAEFLGIAMLVDKYELQEPVQIWAEAWFAGFNRADMMKLDCPEWLFICWIFDLPVRKELARLWYGRICFEKNGDIFFEKEDTKLPFTPRAESGIWDKLKLLRVIYVDSIRHIFESYHAEYSSNHKTNDSYICANKGSVLIPGKAVPICQSLQLGLFILTTSKHGLLEDSFWSRSVSYIDNKFSEFKGVTFIPTNHELWNYHPDCSWVERFKKAMEHERAQVLLKLDEMFTKKDELGITDGWKFDSKMKALERGLGSIVVSMLAEEVRTTGHY